MSDDISFSEYRSVVGSNALKDSYATGREERMRDMAQTTSKIISVDRTYTNREQKQSQMNDALLQAGYDAKQQRIDRLESWVAEAISKPSMPRELRMEGLELVGAERPDIRQSVERICPSRGHEMGRELSIER
jgi:hypothetical protein